MGIFKKRFLEDMQPLINSTDVDGATYEHTIDYLTNVNDADFDKIINIAKIYRKAHSNVAFITGINSEPTESIFEHQSITPTLVPADDLDLAFLDDEQTPAVANPKAPKINIHTGQRP